MSHSESRDTLQQDRKTDKSESEALARIKRQQRLLNGKGYYSKNKWMMREKEENHVVFLMSGSADVLPSTEMNSSQESFIANIRSVTVYPFGPQGESL